MALFFAAFATPAAAIDPLFPTNGNLGIDVKHYRLELKVADNFAEIAGRANLKILALDDLENFSLDLRGLDVARVFVDGTRATFVRTGDKLDITPAKSIAKGTIFSVIVRYSGAVNKIPNPTALFGGALGWRAYTDPTFGPSVYTNAEPIGAATFFPANDAPDDRATFRFLVTVPKAYVAAANGRLVAEQPIGANKRYVYTMNRAMAPWNVMVHISKYKVTKATAGGVPITFYSPTDLHLEQMMKATSMMDFFEETFGDYPFETYGTIGVGDNDFAYQLDGQTLPAFHRFVLFPEIADGMVAQALAAQWFGNSVSVGAWRDIWLSKGLITYSNILWRFRDNPEGFNFELFALHRHLNEAPVGPAVVDSVKRMLSGDTYFRGALAIYAIEMATNRQTALRVLKTWAKRYRGKQPTTEDFVDHVVKVTGKPEMRTMLDAWLYKPELPAFPGPQPEGLVEASPFVKAMAERFEAQR